MRNRKEEIMKAAKPIFIEQFHKSSQKIILFCEQHSQEVVNSFLESFYEALDNASLLQNRKKKNKIKYIQLSHLYSSLFLKQYLLRIDVRDERFYGDISEAESYWNADCIYHLFEEDIQEVKKRIEWSIPRIKEYEIDTLRYTYVPFYHGLMKAFLKNMFEVLMENSDLWRKEGAWANDALWFQKNLQI